MAEKRKFWQHPGSQIPFEPSTQVAQELAGSARKERLLYLAAHAPPMTAEWVEDRVGKGWNEIDAAAKWAKEYAVALLKELES